MTERRRQAGGGGRLWLVLILIPPAVIAVGLAILLVWQGSKGGITPKWRKPVSPPTNPVSPPAVSQP